jgi:Gly-Xaa carboxypeptidase
MFPFSYSYQSIGILSRIIVALEQRPHATSFLRSGTAFANAQCAVAHDPKSSPSLRDLARRALTDDKALRDFQSHLLASVPLFETMLRTTQAVDIVSGGVKANALPEQASALVNHRIAEHA